MTSNFGTVGFSNKNPYIATTEADWTDPKEKGLSVYEKSKLLSEHAAWDFIKKEGGNLEFATSRNVSNEKAKKILGWKPIANNEETILTSIYSMIKFGVIK